MNSTTRLSTQLERQVSDRLASHGARFTEARLRIVAALSHAPGPRSAAELAEAIDHSVPISSLYRNLGVLESAGVVKPHHGVDGLTRHELADWLAGHHHHLVCTGCGLVDDVDLGDDREAALDALARSAGTSVGFHAEGHTLEIEGICRTCADRAAS